MLAILLQINSNREFFDGGRMKSYLFLIFLTLGSIQVSAKYEHPCERLYWKFHSDKEVKSDEDVSEFENRLKKCKELYGKSNLIEKAERYNDEVADRNNKVKAEISKSISVAKGEKSEGQFIKSFNLLEMMKKQVNNAAYAAFIGFPRNDGKIKRNVISAKSVCTEFGYDDAISSTKSERMSATNKDMISNEEVPGAIFGKVKEPGFFKNSKPRVFDLKKDRVMRNPRIFFEYFTSITCVKKIQEGERVPDIEISNEYIEQITTAIEERIKPPRLDTDVKAILSIDDSNRSEKKTESLSQDSDGWKPTSYGDDRDHFIYTPKR